MTGHKCPSIDVRNAVVYYSYKNNICETIKKQKNFCEWGV